MNIAPEQRLTPSEAAQAKAILARFDAMRNKPRVTPAEMATLFPELTPILAGKILALIKATEDCQ